MQATHLLWAIFLQANQVVSQQSASLKYNVAIVKDVAVALQSLATVIALLVGGFWTFRAFVKTRGKHPRAKIEHQVSFRLLPDDSHLLILDVFVENIGQVPISLSRADTWVQQILPLPSEIQTRIDAGHNMVAEGKTEALWTLVGDVHEQTFPNGEFVIDAAERDQFRHNFTLGPNVKTIQVYTYLQPTIGGSGWKLKSTHDVQSENPPSILTI